MRMIRVTQRFDNYCDPHDHGEALFECVSTARNYARKVQQQGKSVTLSVVSLHQDTVHIIQSFAIHEQLVCSACLTKEKPCNLVTTRALEASQKFSAAISVLDVPTLEFQQVASMR